MEPHSRSPFGVIVNDIQALTIRPPPTRSNGARKVLQKVTSEEPGQQWRQDWLLYGSYKF